MRRAPSTDARPVRIDAASESVWCGDARLKLTPRAFAVLRHLVEHAGRLVTKDDLLASVWGDAAVTDAALASPIRDLRRALRDSSRTPRYIETVHRRGFRFIGPIADQNAVAVVGAPRSADAVPDAAPPTFVGREAELARLHELLQRAVDGRRQLVFVTGEPGIGKTALVEAFLAPIGRGQALRIGRGQCVEQYGAGEAYLPVLEAIGRLGRGDGGDRVVQVLMRYAPTWLTQLPALLTDRDLEAVERRAQGATRDRMLRELVEALESLSVESPLVLVLEDLHWSDSATIDLLARLARRREPARLLVIGTYRPSDEAARAHPIRPVQQELAVHGQCADIPLAFLTVAAVDRYLAQRFARHRFPPDLPAVLHKSAGGNPLFVVTTVDHLLAQGHLREADETWDLVPSVSEVAAGTPPTLAQMVEEQLERLTVEEQSVLAVASVAGAEFSAAIAVAGGIDPHDAERRCDALARRERFLRPAGAAEWPDGTIAGRYAFIHALYQQALYARISAGRRAALHLRTGERLEQGYGERAGEIAAELVAHFEQGRDVERAARYRALAGEHALAQHAYHEAADHAARALDLLGTLPESPERQRRQLALHVLRGAALTATLGYAAPDVRAAYACARELCAQAGDAADLCPVLVGLARFYLVSGQLATSRDVGEQLLAAARSAGDPAFELAARNALGVEAFYAGAFTQALAHLERGIALYDRNVHSPTRSATFRLGQDPGVSCMTHAALTLWMLGYPARAVARMDEAFALARSLDHPFSVSYACHFASGLYQWLGDRATVEALEAEAFALDTYHGFGLFLTAGKVYRGWVLAQQRSADAGLAQMQEGVAEHREIGAEILVPAFLALEAETRGKLGQRAPALSAVTEALAVGRGSGQHYWEAELHRIEGLLTDGPEASRESCFLRALEIARRQDARALELRAAISLSRLWRESGRVTEARDLLSAVFNWFTEGQDTADLRKAQSLLAALGDRPDASAARRTSSPSDAERGRR